jgi:hypothetical protein
MLPHKPHSKPPNRLPKPPQDKILAVNSHKKAPFPVNEAFL